MNPIKIKFDANQQFQLDAIQAVVDVFDGQPRAEGQFEIRLSRARSDQLMSLGVGNQLMLDEQTILENVRHAQQHPADRET